MCNCKKKQEEPKEEILINTPEQLHTIELNEWNGGINKEEIKEDNKDQNGNN